MAGYLPDDATAAAFADGWYRTGDVGWLEPDGWVHLTDRRKEMIKVSGFQVAPAEIEAVLHGHPAVIDCAVFGVPDERPGEVPVAAVQLEPNATVTAEDLQRLVADALATYKHLHQWSWSTSIPRTPSGKVLRRSLRDEWAPQLSPTRPAQPADGRPPLRRSSRRCATPRRRWSTGSAPRPSPISTTPNARPSSTPPSPRRAGASCAPPWTAVDLWRRPWRSAIVAEELGRRLADTAFLGPMLAAELRRRAGAPDAAAPETVALRHDLSAPTAAVDGALPSGAVAIDARGAESALVLMPDAGGYALGAVALGGTAAGPDLTRRRRH